MKPQDLDRLSLYLDDQLPAAERAAIEARLGSEPDLRAALAELRLTVQALRGLPTVRPPRSFTLTPAQAGTALRRPGQGAFGALRLATALAALVLVVTVAGDFASSRLTPGAASTNMAAMPAEATQVAQAEMPPAAQTTETARSAGEGVGEPAAGAAGAEAATPMPMPAATAAPLGTPAPAAMAPAPTATPEEVAALGAEAPTEPANEGDGLRTLEATEEQSPKGAATQEALPGATDMEDSQAADAYAAEAAEPPASPTLPPIRVVELALAGLTVLLGLSTWLARRAR